MASSARNNSLALVIYGGTSRVIICSWRCGETKARLPVKIFLADVANNSSIAGKWYY
jgi:hypothetical protein